jgi:hypothetical protein
MGLSLGHDIVLLDNLAQPSSRCDCVLKECRVLLSCSHVVEHTLYQSEGRLEPLEVLERDQSPQLRLLVGRIILERTHGLCGLQGE